MAEKFASREKHASFPGEKLKLKVHHFNSYCNLIFHVTHQNLAVISFIKLLSSFSQLSYSLYSNILDVTYYLLYVYNFKTSIGERRSVRDSCKYDLSLSLSLSLCMCVSCTLSLSLLLAFSLCVRSRAKCTDLETLV